MKYSQILKNEEFEAIKKYVPPHSANNFHPMLNINKGYKLSHLMTMICF
jgi:hypothetical protein